MNIWIRKDLKQNAREDVRKNYWAAVIVSLVLAVVTATGGRGASNGAARSVTHDYHYQVDEFSLGTDIAEKIGNLMTDFTQGFPWSFLASLFSLGSFVVFAVIVVIFHFIIGNLLEVGAKGFYVENLYSMPGVGRLLAAMRNASRGNVIKTMFLRDLKVFLWSLLFVVPGLIKSYEYRMVPYLLAEYPDMPQEEAFSRSCQMMYGQKWDAFVLDLSFLPWKILSGITVGIVGVFYVNPYMDATNAELYDVLAERMQNEGGAYYGK